MKQHSPYRYGLPLILAAALSACATLAPPSPDNAATSPAAEAAAPQASIAAKPAAAVPAAKPAASAKAAVPTLPAGLDLSVRRYLENLVAAVRRGDGAYLAAQAEPNYAQRLASAWDRPSYLALLYRVGPYAADAPDAPDKPPRIDPLDLVDLKLDGFESYGPVIELSGRFVLRSGREIPCRITLLYRLDPPRVIGFEP
jgi:hypothetical protein